MGLQAVGGKDRIGDRSWRRKICPWRVDLISEGMCNQRPHQATLSLRWVT